MNQATKPARYQKRPIVITARQLTEPIEIETLEGTMRGTAGDWLITGIKGESYICAPDVFDKTYDPVKTADAKPLEVRLRTALRERTGLLLSLADIEEIIDSMDRLDDVRMAAGR